MRQPADDPRVAELFARAVAMPPAERGAFVRAQLPDDPAVADEVLALLAADQESTQPPFRSPWRSDVAGMPAVLGPYRLVGELGEGAMGRVFRATQDQPIRRQVAIKVLKGHLVSTAARARFDAERRALARLQHAGIARVLDGGHDERGRPFLVMDFVDGVPMPQWLASSRPSVEVRLDVFVAIGDAVQHAHGKGVVHRDLKPSNVLIAGGDQGPTPRLIDFGIARLLDTDDGEPTLHTAGEVVMGTAGYMSPEQARDSGSADARSDVWALGAMLYEVLTTELPYGRNAPPAVQAASPIRPSRHPGRVGSFPVDLDLVVLQALAIEPERRYATVQEFVADVQRARRAEPVAAREPTWTYLASRFLRRHRVGAVLTVAVAASLLAGGAAFGLMWAKADRHWRDYRRLADDKRLADLQREARDALWPAWPATIPAMDHWLECARSLLARRDELAARAAELPAAEAAATEPREREELAWQHDVLQRLLAGMDELAGPASVDNIAGVTARREQAVRVGRADHDAAAAWQAAMDDIAKQPVYGGLRLPGPQVGLVPLGRDAASGLWQFWHVESGERPELQENAHGDTTGLVVGEPTGMVFVLLPGGRFTIGALPSGDERSGTAAIDPDAAPMERFVHDVTLAPFFAAKHECTQGQWYRLVGDKPSFVTPLSKARGHRGDLRHPVEQVDWVAAERELARRGLLLPTEAQWEYFARAGTRTIFGGLPDGGDLSHHANLADAGSKGSLRVELEAGLDDGHALTAPVGSFAANPFGLHDCHGNVAEWCRDLLVPYSRPARTGDGLRTPLASDDTATLRVMRGGDFAERRLLSRVASRNAHPPGQRTARVGLRAVRAILPP